MTLRSLLYAGLMAAAGVTAGGIDTVVAAEPEQSVVQLTYEQEARQFANLLWQYHMKVEEVQKVMSNLSKAQENRSDRPKERRHYAPSSGDGMGLEEFYEYHFSLERGEFPRQEETRTVVPISPENRLMYRIQVNYGENTTANYAIWETEQDAQGYFVRHPPHVIGDCGADSLKQGFNSEITRIRNRAIFSDVDFDQSAINMGEKARGCEDSFLHLGAEYNYLESDDFVGTKIYFGQGSNPETLDKANQTLMGMIRNITPRLRASLQDMEAKEKEFFALIEKEDRKIRERELRRSAPHDSDLWGPSYKPQ